MANTPKKMKDPTEAALSAIQDALNVRDAEPSSQPMTGPSATALPAEDAGSERAWPGLRLGKGAKAESFEDPTRRAEDAESLRAPEDNPL